jgi:hypothetical protein
LTATVGERVDQRWLLLVPPSAVVVDLTRPAQARALLAGVPSGTRVAVIGGARSRRFARRHGVSADRVYLAVPSLAQPVVVAEVTDAALRWFTGNVLTVPSGRSRFHGLIWGAVQVARRWPRLLVRMPIGERIVIGARR